MGMMMAVVLVKIVVVVEWVLLVVLVVVLAIVLAVVVVVAVFGPKQPPTGATMSYCYVRNYGTGLIYREWEFQRGTLHYCYWRRNGHYGGENHKIFSIHILWRWEEPFERGIFGYYKMLLYT